jgi:hypothetical protein
VLLAARVVEDVIEQNQSNHPSSRSVRTGTPGFRYLSALSLAVCRSPPDALGAATALKSS